MNIRNIVALAEQLQTLGFENTGSSLVNRICFKPENFLLSQRIRKGKDHLIFQLFLEKESKQNSYLLRYYDVILQKEIAITHLTINGVDSAALEKLMAEIDWKMAFDFDREKQWNAEDKTSWEKERQIESIAEGLTVLETVEEGKVVSAALKLKYWSGIPNEEFVGNNNTLKTRNEIAQRFYFIEAQEGINVDEAYRFLQNRWMEKLIQAKRKQADGIAVEEMPNARHPSIGNGPLIKKRVTKLKGKK